MKKLQLSRLVEGVPKQPAVWLAGGVAVHRVTELYDLAFEAGEKTFDLPGTWAMCYSSILEELREQEPDTTKWRSSKTEGVEEWNAVGLEQCKAWFQWRRRNPQMRVAMIGGDPAIELDACTKLPGCEIEVMAYPDRVMHDTVLDTMSIIDIKTGSRKPDNALQFGTYRACIEQKFGVSVTVGSAFMTRKGLLTQPYDLTKYTPAYIGREMGKMHAAVKAGAFTSHPSPSCERMCDVRAACYAWGGELAEKFDPDYDPSGF